MSQRRRFLVEIEDAGGADSSPSAVRLRMLLKAMLRAWRFRCVWAREVPAEGQEAMEAMEPVEEVRHG